MKSLFSLKLSLDELVAGCLITLLLYTGVSKLINLSAFYAQLSLFPFLKTLARPLTWIVPLLEIGISLLLILPAYRLPGFYLALVVLIAFTGYLTGMLTLKKHLPCPCGGVISYFTWQEHLFLNLTLLTFCCLGICSLKYRVPDKLPQIKTFLSKSLLRNKQGKPKT